MDSIASKTTLELQNTLKEKESTCNKIFFEFINKYFTYQSNLQCDDNQWKHHQLSVDLELLSNNKTIYSLV